MHASFPIGLAYGSCTTERSCQVGQTGEQSVSEDSDQMSAQLEPNCAAVPANQRCKFHCTAIALRFRLCSCPQRGKQPWMCVLHTRKQSRLTQQTGESESSSPQSTGKFIVNSLAFLYLSKKSWLTYRFYAGVSTVLTFLLTRFCFHQVTSVEDATSSWKRVCKKRVHRELRRKTLFDWRWL